MSALDLSIDATWASGLMLALTRVSAFVVASPLMSRALPATGRLAFVIAGGVFLTEPVPGVSSLGDLAGLSLANVGVGVILGYLTGLLFYAFTSAGGLVDITSNLSVAMLFDPSQGEQAAVFSRLFQQMGLVLVMIAGGFGAVVAVLSWSIDAVPLDGVPLLGPGLARAALDGLGRLMVVMIEIAMPVIGGMFLVEIALGIAARFAPQANVFLIGIPAKLLLAFALVGISVVMLPQVAESYLGFMRDTTIGVLRAFGADAPATG